MQERKWVRVGKTTDGNVIHFLIINMPHLYSALHTPINMLTEPLSHKVQAYAGIHTQICVIHARRMDLFMILWVPDKYRWQRSSLQWSFPPILSRTDEVYILWPGIEWLCIHADIFAVDQTLLAVNSETVVDWTCILSHTHVHTPRNRDRAPHIEPSTAASMVLDWFVLISAAHWCKEEFIKKKKAESEHQIGECRALHSPVVIIAKSKREGWLVIKVIRWNWKKLLLIGPCHCGFSILSVFPSLCSHHCAHRQAEEQKALEHWIPRETQPAEDLAATVWERRQGQAGTRTG